MPRQSPAKTTRSSDDSKRTPARTPTTAGTKAASKADRRQQLTIAALRLFSQHPYDDVSIDDIASEAGAAHGLVSYYFGGKRGVYLAALAMVQRDLDSLTQPLQSDGDVTAQIKGMSRRHFEYFRAHPHLMIGMLHSGPADPQTSQIAEANQASGARALVRMLNLPENDQPAALEAALRGCMGFVNALTVHWLTHDQDLSIDRVVDLVFDVVTAATASAVGISTVEAALGRPLAGR